VKSKNLDFTPFFVDRNP